MSGITKTSKASVAEQLVGELHHAARRNFIRQRTQMRGINDTLQADLVEMIPYARQNQGMKYILTVINIFSKKAYARPLKRKTGEEVKNALESVLKSLGHSIRHIHTDRGKEFYNGTVRAMLKRYNVRLYSTFTTMKAAICERFNRTLKSKMWKLFTLNGTHRWTDILPKLISEYNKTVHSTIKMRPNDVNTRNEEQLLLGVYNYAVDRPIKRRFKVGDPVRMSRHKRVFEKGYTPNWTADVFTIRKVLATSPTTYLLTDWQGYEVRGAVYAEELQLTKHPDEYLIEKILKRKDNRVLVKWLGFDNEFNQWVDEGRVSKRT